MSSLPLTETHAKVLTLVCAGYTNRQIGQTLAMAESTVKNHLNAIYKRTGAVSREDLIAARGQQPAGRAPGLYRGFPPSLF